MTKQIQLNFDDVNQSILLMCAFRYALGGRSYATSSIIEVIKANIPNMGDITKAKYATEIENAIKNNLAGGKYEIEEWQSVLEMLK